MLLRVKGKNLYYKENQPPQRYLYYMREAVNLKIIYGVGA
jgi:hypothetical protein